MIQEFIDRFLDRKAEVKDRLAESFPGGYPDLFKIAVEAIRGEEDDWSDEYPSSEHIRIVNDGDYQGLLVLIASCGGYQPSQYWCTSVYYGSCSACDTFQAISNSDWDREKPSQAQVDQYWLLCLHMVEKMRKMT